MKNGASVHRGDSASWTDGHRVLGFQAGLGGRPGEVYLPLASKWSSLAPSWALELREAIAADFQALGLRVVASPRASVSDCGPLKKNA